MDVTTELIKYLDTSTAIEWFHEAPTKETEFGHLTEFGTVERDGGITEIVRDIPTLTLFVYAATRARAAALSESAKRALIAAKWSIPNVFTVDIMSDYYDEVDGKPRHRITASLTVND